VITPRHITLCRVPDLAAFRTTIVDWISTLAPEASGDTFVLVPTRAAAEQLRRTVEDRKLSEIIALLWPMVATRRDLYQELASRLVDPPAMLSPFEREVVISSVARAVEDEGLAPPFQMRPGLVAEIVALYDQIHRLGRRLGDFERNFQDELEREHETDRGAERLLQQTIFLVAVYRGYELRLTEEGRCDEHVLRERVLAEAPARPLRRVIVSVGDHLADPDGVWPVDLDLLTRLHGLEQLDLISTEAMLGAGMLERLHAALPGLVETSSPWPRSRHTPCLVEHVAGATGGTDAIVLTHRDREEELAAVARRVKTERAAGSASPLHRTALVVRRPLPYLYLARDVFADAAIPFETLDTLPLAAEPYAAAVDLALDAVESDFTRSALLSLVHSPHFKFDDTPVTNSAIAAFDVALSEARFLGGLERLRPLVGAWESIAAPASREERRQQAALPVARIALRAAEALSPLAVTRPMTAQILTLIEWLRRFDRPADVAEPVGSRRLRVRGAVLGTLSGLAEAFERHDPGAYGDVATLSAGLKRWLGEQTFAATSGRSGLQIVDAQAARYGDFDDLQIVGLIEGDWPERFRRGVLYPASLMALLEPLPATGDPARRERDALLSARAAFKDLVFSPTARVRLSTFTLENDAVVEPSILLDDVASFGLPEQRVVQRPARVAYSDALALEPRVPEVIAGAAAEWAVTRLTHDDRDIERFRGEAGPWTLPRVSVSRLERYLDCPFRFFASEVLRLEEEPEDEDTRTPLERGRFLHELWEWFFAEWQKRGHGRIDADRLPEAQQLFEELCEAALARLSPAEAALERHRLLGSAVNPGIAHRVFAVEAGRRTGIAARLLEFPLEGDFSFRTREGHTRSVALRAKADRIDVLEDGTLRIIDYKSKKTPDPKLALQLPIYSFCAQQSMRAERSERWPIAEALYLSFEGDKAVVPLRAKGRTIDELLEDAQDRMLRTLDAIARGSFPPRPARKSLCGPCPYRVVCRLEIVESAAESSGD
jgi:RecB family exonuclease